MKSLIPAPSGCQGPFVSILLGPLMFYKISRKKTAHLWSQKQGYLEKMLGFFCVERKDYPVLFKNQNKSSTNAYPTNEPAVRKGMAG